MQSILKYSVADVMTKSPITVTLNTLLSVLVEEFDRTDFNGYPVLDGNRLVGIVTQYDLLKAFIFSPNQIIPRYREILQKKVADIFTPSVERIYPTMPVTKAIALMVDSGHHVLMVVNEQEHLIGILTRYDIARCLRAAAQSE